MAARAGFPATTAQFKFRRFLETLGDPATSSVEVVFSSVAATCAALPRRRSASSADTGGQFSHFGHPCFVGAVTRHYLRYFLLPTQPS